MLCYFENGYTFVYRENNKFLNKLTFYLYNAEAFPRNTQSNYSRFFFIT